jgi:hypothetical protein
MAGDYQVFILDTPYSPKYACNSKIGRPKNNELILMYQTILVSIAVYMLAKYRWHPY